jgi:AAA domain-containing protein
MGRDANDILQEAGPDAIAEMLAKAKPYKAKSKAKPNGVHAPPPISTKLLGNALAPNPSALQPERQVTMPLEIYGKLSNTIPPRHWVLGTTWCRKFPSGLFAPGGVGKTSLRIAQAVAVTTGQAITGEFVHWRAKALYICLEDDIDEIQRRFRACLLHHGLEYPEGWLYFCAPGRRSGKLVSRDLMKADLVHYMEAAVLEYGIDVIIIDPLVKAHGLEENSNTDMDAVLAIIADLSIAADIVVDFLHHTAKGPQEAGNVDKARGASAIKDGGRLMKSLTVMSPEEAKIFGIKDDTVRKSLVRYDNGKVNLVKAAHAQWFKLVSVDIGNGTPEYPNGDNVQAIEVWTPPDVFDGLNTSKTNEILDIFDEAWNAGTPYSDAAAATTRAAWKVVSEATGKDKEPSRSIVATWVENKVLVHADYYDKADRKERKGLKVDPTKRPGAIRE